MKKTIIPIVVSILTIFGFSVFGQTQIYLAKGEKIKKNNNLFGIFYNKEWEVPCKYDKIEAFEGNYLSAFHGNGLDIYENSYGKKLLQENLPVKHLNLYKSFANTGVYPIYSNGKWGFTTKYTKVEPRYDSLFTLCLEGFDLLPKSCSSLIGVSLDGSIGFCEGGKLLFLEKDYNKIRYWYTGGDKGSEVITC